ncbi:MAG: hypothetical protein HQ536_03815 [Parcubacteria group bacterium]|nr:hypothetical protein [Parcubacteria group bacterium]
MFILIGKRRSRNERWNFSLKELECKFLGCFTLLPSCYQGEYPYVLEGNRITRPFRTYEEAKKWVNEWKMPEEAFWVGLV